MLNCTKGAYAAASAADEEVDEEDEDDDDVVGKWAKSNRHKPLSEPVTTCWSEPANANEYTRLLSDVRKTLVGMVGGNTATKPASLPHAYTPDAENAELNMVKGISSTDPPQQIPHQAREGVQKANVFFGRDEQKHARFSSRVLVVIKLLGFWGSVPGSSRRVLI
jgi:hypothetical protein